jgi:hypothetical protein
MDFERPLKQFQTPFDKLRPGFSKKKILNPKDNNLIFKNVLTRKVYFYNKITFLLILFWILK